VNHDVLEKRSYLRRSGNYFPDESFFPIADVIGIRLVEVQAPCDLAAGYELTWKFKGKQTVVAVVRTPDVKVAFEF
jgi:hypothetical protein